MHGRIFRLVMLIELRLVVFHHCYIFFVREDKYTTKKRIPSKKSSYILFLFDFNHLGDIALRFGWLAWKFDAEYSVAHAGVDGFLYHILGKNEGLLELGVRKFPA